MITDEKDPMMRDAVRIIGDELKNKYLGRDLTLANVERMIEHIDVVRTRLRFSHGVDIPALVPIVLPRHGYVQLVRRDLEHAGLQIIIRNLAIMFPDVHAATELAPAIRAAFPDYDPAKKLN